MAQLEEVHAEMRLLHEQVGRLGTFCVGQENTAPLPPISPSLHMPLSFPLFPLNMHIALL